MPTIHEAKTNLSRLIEKAERGEEVVISRGKQPVVRLVPIAKPEGKRPIGMLEHKYKGMFGPEFFAPLTEEELADWYK